MSNVRFNLDRLLKPHDFPIDPKDNIKSAKITSIRLKPLNGECDITVKIPENSNKTLHEIASRWINFDSSEVVNVFTVREVEIIISFKEDNKNINLQIKSDGSHSLPDFASELTNKYLKYWELAA